MIEKAFVRKMVEEILKGEDFFLVNVSVTPSNKITIVVDSLKGITIEQCAVINREVESLLDRNVEDYELVVSSPGLDSELKVIEQYHKNIGRELEIIMKDQSRYNGVLTYVGEKEITIREDTVRSGRNNLKSETRGEERKIILDEVKKAKVRIQF
jgi:ribosome maturation factor RimP